jgi:hypothetical protein
MQRTRTSIRGTKDSRPIVHTSRVYPIYIKSSSSSTSSYASVSTLPIVFCDPSAAFGLVVVWVSVKGVSEFGQTDMWGRGIKADDGRCWVRLCRILGGQCRSGSDARSFFSFVGAAWVRANDRNTECPGASCRGFNGRRDAPPLTQAPCQINAGSARRITWSRTPQRPGRIILTFFFPLALSLSSCCLVLPKTLNALDTFLVCTAVKLSHRSLASCSTNEA